MRKIDPLLHERLLNLISSMGYQLLGCEIISQGRGKLFRIYIDTKDDDKSITVEDCSRVSHQVSAMFDVEDPIEGAYTLEVSSPGIDRPLFEIDQYQKYIGSRLKIRLHSSIGERRQFKGILKRVEGESIFLLVDDMQDEINLPFSAIEKANLIGDVRLV